MRTKNFFKGLAVAALVGVFATSCSEEELNVNGTINGPQVDPYTPTELPDGVAYAAISVVDLGDLGLGSKVLYTESKDVTALNGAAIECPDFEGMEDYVIPAAQTISVPTLSKGQTVTIPVTFYVVKLTSAFAKVEWDINTPALNGSDMIPGDVVVTKGSETKSLQNLSNYWKNVFVKYPVYTGPLAEVLEYSTEKPEDTPFETEGEEGEGTEDEEEGEGTEDEEEGEGTEDEEEGEEAAEAFFTIDYTTASAYPYYRMDEPEGCTYDVVDGALVIKNEVEQANFWDVQPFIADQFSVKEGYNYTICITMKADADGSATLNMGTWSANSTGTLNFTASEEYKTYEVAIAATFGSDANDVHVLFQSGKFVGTVEIAKVEIYEAPAAKAAATEAEEIIKAYVEQIVLASEENAEEFVYMAQTGEVCLFSGACVDFTKTTMMNKVAYAFEYMGETIYVTFLNNAWTVGQLGTPYAIPGHETEYSHSAGHGHYEHDIHGNHLNAGGGITIWE